MHLARLLIAFPAVVILSGCQATEDFRARAVRRIQSVAICSLVQIPAVDEGLTRSTSPEPLRLNRRKPVSPPAAKPRMERARAVAAFAPSASPDQKGMDDLQSVPQKALNEVAREEVVVSFAGRADRVVSRSGVIFERRLRAVPPVPVVKAVALLREPVPVVRPAEEAPCSFTVVPQPLHISATVLPRPAAGIATGGGTLCPSPGSGPCAQTALR